MALSERLFAAQYSVASWNSHWAWNSESVPNPDSAGWPGTNNLTSLSLHFLIHDVKTRVIPQDSQKD